MRGAVGRRFGDRPRVELKPPDRALLRAADGALRALNGSVLPLVLASQRSALLGRSPESPDADGPPSPLEDAERVLRTLAFAGADPHVSVYYEPEPAEADDSERVPRIFVRWQQEDRCFDAAEGGEGDMIRGFADFVAELAEVAPRAWGVHWGRETSERSFAALSAVSERTVRRPIILQGDRLLDLERAVRGAFSPPDFDRETLLIRLAAWNWATHEFSMREDADRKDPEVARSFGFWAVSATERLLAAAAKGTLAAAPAPVFATLPELKALAELERTAGPVEAAPELYGSVSMKDAAKIFACDPATIRRWADTGTRGKKGPPSPVVRPEGVSKRKVMIRKDRLGEPERRRFEAYLIDSKSRDQRAFAGRADPPG